MSIVRTTLACALIATLTPAAVAGQVFASASETSAPGGSVPAASAPESTTATTVVVSVPSQAAGSLPVGGQSSTTVSPSTAPSATTLNPPTAAPEDLGGIGVTPRAGQTRICQNSATPHIGGLCEPPCVERRLRPDDCSARDYWRQARGLFGRGNPELSLKVAKAILSPQVSGNKHHFIDNADLNGMTSMIAAQWVNKFLQCSVKAKKTVAKGSELLNVVLRMPVRNPVSGAIRNAAPNIWAEVTRIGLDQRATEAIRGIGEGTLPMSPNACPFGS